MAVIDGEGELVSAHIAGVRRVDVVAVGVVDRHRAVGGLRCDGVAQRIAVDIGTGDGAGDLVILVAGSAAGDGHRRVIDGLDGDGRGSDGAGAGGIGDLVGEGVNAVEIQRRHIDELATAERHTAMARLAVDRVSGGVAGVDVAGRRRDVDAGSIFSAGGEDVGSNRCVIGSSQGDRHGLGRAGGQAIAGGKGEAVRAVVVGGRGVHVGAIGAEHHGAMRRARADGEGQCRAFDVGAGDGAADRGIFNACSRRGGGHGGVVDCRDGDVGGSNGRSARAIGDTVLEAVRTIEVGVRNVLELTGDQRNGAAGRVGNHGVGGGVAGVRIGGRWGDGDGDRIFSARSKHGVGRRAIVGAGDGDRQDAIAGRALAVGDRVGHGHSAGLAGADVVVGGVGRVEGVSTVGAEAQASDRRLGDGEREAQGVILCIGVIGGHGAGNGQAAFGGGIGVSVRDRRGVRLIGQHQHGQIGRRVGRVDRVGVGRIDRVIEIQGGGAEGGIAFQGCQTSHCCRQQRGAGGTASQLADQIGLRFGRNGARHVQVGGDFRRPLGVGETGEVGVQLCADICDVANSLEGGQVGEARGCVIQRLDHANDLDFKNIGKQICHLIIPRC